MVVGGARSGKTSAAESLLAGRSDVTYVATGYAVGTDDEWRERVERHRRLRPATWTTLETLDLVGTLAEPGGPMLVDCLTLWLTRMMDDHGCWDDATWNNGGADALVRSMDALVAAVQATSRDLVVVTNEVGQGVVPSTPSGRRFQDEMGRLNTKVAAVCDDVLLCVAGRTLKLS